jgi:hypothetical protein
MLLLTLVNIGFVIAVVRMSRVDQTENREMPRRGPRFMESEIGFNTEQMEAFRQSRKEFRQQMHPIFMELRELNRQLVVEATSEKPDSANAARLSRTIGDKHREIKEITYRHFEEVSRGASAEQKEKLRQFYFNMFDDGQHMRKGRGRHGNNQ